MRPTTRSFARFRAASRHPAVWLRAAKLGLVVGFIQVSINQGDHWLRHEVDTAVVIKSVLSPLLSFAIAFASAVATQADNPPSSP
jgi:hypothetical protein